MATNPRDFAGVPPVTSKAAACVTQGIKIKGELSGSEDLFIDGQVEGVVSFPNSSVTVGPNAKVKAEITAREVVVRGRVEGKISGSEKNSGLELGAHPRRHEVGTHCSGRRRGIARHHGSRKIG